MRHRAMDFLVALFRNLIEHPGWAMSQACTDSYNKTLKKWHGWLASSSFTVAMKLTPDTKKFMEVIQGGGDVNADIENFVLPFLLTLKRITTFWYFQIICKTWSSTFCCRTYSM
ncbi:Glycolipid transfer protein 1 [Trifolium repens]|nr:Glycolipid transfer protein 1 [Trifolium repens]